MGRFAAPLFMAHRAILYHPDSGIYGRQELSGAAASGSYTAILETPQLRHHISCDGSLPAGADAAAIYAGER